MRIRPSIAFVPFLLPGSAPAAQDEEGRAQDERPATIEGLERRIELLEQEQADELEDLHFQLESLEGELATLRADSQSAQRANVFNPGITVFGNFLGRADDRQVFLEDDRRLERVDDRFNLREVELDLRAAIDPWADGVLIATFESEVPNEFEAGIEEGYVVLKKLPVLNSAPAGLKLKAGRFRPGFGRFNMIHLHDLPQTSYPRALTTFLGEEGYVQNGLSGRFFLPSPSESQTLEATVGVLDGGDIPIAPTEEGSNLAGLGHLGWFADLGGGSSLELGASLWQSDGDHRLYGLDASYKWKPLAGGEWRSFLVGGEVFGADLDDPALDSRPTGFYLWSQYQLDRNIYLGVRYDRSEDLTDTDLHTDTVGAYLTYYTSEFLRLRIGVEHTESDDPLLDGLDSAFLELNFVFGSHPVEPYWVNR